MNRFFVVAGAIVLSCAPGVANATTTALLVGGKGEYAELTPEQMATAFGGYFAGYDQRISIPFPGDAPFKTAIQVGADNLYAAVYATPGPKTIGGVSKGAPAVPMVLNRLMDDAQDTTDGRVPPPPSELNVAIYGTPSRSYLGVAYQPVPETPYDVLIVSAEYDGIADFPDKRGNLLAVLNASMGADQLHVDAAFFDIRNQPTEYSIVTNSLGGTTTTILIPTPVLPLLTPMRDRGASPEAIARLDKMLRPIIDSAYDRPPMQLGVPPTLTGPPSAAPAGTSAPDSAATGSTARTADRSTDVERRKSATSRFWSKKTARAVAPVKGDTVDHEVTQPRRAKDRAATRAAVRAENSKTAQKPSTASKGADGDAA